MKGKNHIIFMLKELYKPLMVYLLKAVVSDSLQVILLQAVTVRLKEPSRVTPGRVVSFSSR